jgi:hypothetical protein
MPDGTQHPIDHRIFSGTLIFTTDDYLVQEVPNGPFVDVSYTFVDEELNHKEVSILGTENYVYALIDFDSNHENGQNK